MKPKETEVSPREFWIMKAEDSNQALVFHPGEIMAGQGLIHVREVLPDAQETAEVVPEFERDESVERACVHFDFKWPEYLWTGVMFFEGRRITRDEFNQGVEAARNSKRSETKRGSK